MLDQKWVAITSVALMALVTLFSFLSLFGAWAYDGERTFGATAFGFDGVSTVTDSDKITIAMGSESLDDADGIGMARAMGVLAVIAVSMFVVSFLAYENQWLVGQPWLGWLGLSTSAIGGLLWVLVLIMFPIAINGLADSTGGFGSPDLSWSSGLVFAILAGVFALGSVGFTLVQRLLATGFRLEVADDTPANFD